MPDRGLTHLDPLGRARMVDVTPKEQTQRRAVARGRVHMQSETTALVARGAVNKGDVLSVAPMMEWTTRHYRFLARLLSRRTRLFLSNAISFSVHRSYATVSRTKGCFWSKERRP